MLSVVGAAQLCTPGRQHSVGMQQALSSCCGVAGAEAQAARAWPFPLARPFSRTSAGASP